MIWWQYPLSDILGDDGITIATPAGDIFASGQSKLSIDGLANAIDGNGNPRPIGQIEGLDFEDYNQYRVDLTQNPSVLIKKS